jgi:hypothetical protein
VELPTVPVYNGRAGSLKGNKPASKRSNLCKDKGSSRQVLKGLTTLCIVHQAYMFRMSSNLIE